MHVPHKRKPASRREHAVNLGKRAIGIEPVERLRRDRDIEGAVRERNRLRDARDDPHGRQRLGKHVPHRSDGLKRVDRPGVRSNQPRELSGARADVEHARATGAYFPHEQLGG